MSKKQIDNYIPKAIDVLNGEFESGVIPSAYNGYISSFGASVIQSGLKPTLAIFENKNSNTKEDKSYLTKLILKIIAPQENGDSLLGYILTQNEEDIIKEKVLDASIALKLSIRTFVLKKDKS